uniref:Uncharacterized protein n=1 Tax=Plectus sambesii TaxID=2011161 RepID=A0A914WSQ0_9BILA
MLVRVLPDASGGGINFNDVEPLPSIFFVLQRTFVKRVIFEDAWPYLMLADVQKKLADNQFVSFVEDLVLVHNTNYPVFFMHAMRLHAAKIQKMERRAVEGDAQLPSPTHLLSIFPFLKSLHVRERVETHMILKQIPSESLAKNFLAKSLGAIGAMLLEVYGSSAVPVSIEFICWDSFQQMQCDYLRDSLKTRLPTCPVDERIVSQTGKEVELTIAQGRTSVCFLIRIPPLA